MAQRLMWLWAVGALLSACTQGSTVSEDTVIDQLVAVGPLGLPRSGLPPLETGCHADASGIPTLNPGEKCSSTYTRQFSGDLETGYTMTESIYVYAMGDTSDATGELNPWDQDGGHFCTVNFDVYPEAVAGFSDSDVVKLTFVIDSVEDDYPDLDPCAHKNPGEEHSEHAYRSTEGGSFLFLPGWAQSLQGESMLFSGLFGVEGSGCMSLSECPEGGSMQLYESCDPLLPGTGGIGYCASICRLFGPGNDLPVCDSTMVSAFPTSIELCDATRMEGHPEYR